MSMGFLGSTDHEDEDADPVGAPRDPIGMLTRHAVAAGLIREGDKPDQMMVDFWMSAIDAAAAVADRFPNPDNDEDTVGDVIRAELYE